jgi:hypothetical protein
MRPPRDQHREPFPQRDLRLGALLRGGGAGVPEHEVDWERLTARVSTRVARALRQSNPGWSAAMPVRLPAIAAALLVMASAALLLGEVAWSDRIALAPVAAERLALARIVSTVRDEETFGLLFNAAGGDLFEFRTSR